MPRGEASVEKPVEVLVPEILNPDPPGARRAPKTPNTTPRASSTAAGDPMTSNPGGHPMPDAPRASSDLGVRRQLPGLEAEPRRVRRRRRRVGRLRGRRRWGHWRTFGSNRFEGFDVGFEYSVRARTRAVYGGYDSSRKVFRGGCLLASPPTGRARGWGACAAEPGRAGGPPPRSEESEHRIIASLMAARGGAESVPPRDGTAAPSPVPCSWRAD